MLGLKLTNCYLLLICVVRYFCGDVIGSDDKFKSLPGIMKTFLGIHNSA